jgi:heterodisulfide reductase subunit A
MVPRNDTWDLAKILGVNLGEEGFLEGKPRDFTETNVAGVFLAGTCQGPKDIPDSIAHGIAAAKKAREVLTKWK